MTRRLAGTGTIIPRGDGKFRVGVQDHRRRRVWLGVVGSREEAEDLLDGVLAERAASHHTHTVAAWMKGVLDQRELDGYRSIKSARSVFHAHVEASAIAGVPLVELTRRDVRAWLRLVQKGRSAQTARNALNLLRSCLQEAVVDELLETNPAEGVEITRREARTDEPWTYLTPDELARLVGVATHEEGLVIRFAAGTGLRAGEVAALRLADLHVDDDQPHVVVRYGGLPAKPTKSGKPRRVPLFGGALEAAKAWLKVLERVEDNDRGLAFPTLRGCGRRVGRMLGRVHLGLGPDGKRKWKDRFESLCQAAGLLEDPARPLVWHSLRHTCASWAVSGWWGRAWSLEEVRELLGHESVTTTERYAHLAGTALERAAAETRKIHGGSTAVAAIVNELVFSAPPTGIEPVAFGLGSAGDPEGPREVAPWMDLRRISEELLQMAAAGDPRAHGLARAFARALVGAGLAIASDELRGLDRAVEVARGVVEATGDELEQLAGRCG